MLKNCTAALNKGKKKKPGKEKDGKPAQDYYTGLGTAKDIPKFIQTNGRVLNNHMPKGTCEDILKECWQMKAPIYPNVPQFNPI